MRKDAAAYLYGGSAYRAATMSAQLQSTETRMPAWHQHSIESDRLHMCQMCSTSWWKSWRSRCLSIDFERTSPAAVAAEPSACHCRWSHESHCRSVGMSAAGSNGRRRTQDAANNVLDVVAVLVIFFEAKLVRALQHSLGVVKPATRDWDRILPEKQQRTPHKVGHTCSRTNCGTRSCFAANTARYNAYVVRVISACMTRNAAVPQGTNTVSS